MQLDPSASHANVAGRGTSVRPVPAEPTPHAPPAPDLPALDLPAWRGSWDDDDPDANFKAEVAAYQAADPLTTIAVLSRRCDIPVPALVRYVLARWASAGSEGLLELGPQLARRLHAIAAAAAADGGVDARLAAFEQLHQMLSWLVVPLQVEPDEQTELDEQAELPVDR